MTVKVLPAIVSVAARAMLLVLPATENSVRPLPMPLDPLSTWIHDAWLVALQEQSVALAMIPTEARVPALAASGTGVPDAVSS